jgi:hypothetical protein
MRLDISIINKYRNPLIALCIIVIGVSIVFALSKRGRGSQPQYVTVEEFQKLAEEFKDYKKTTDQVLSDHNTKLADLKSSKAPEPPKLAAPTTPATTATSASDPKPSTTPPAATATTPTTNKPVAEAKPDTTPAPAADAEKTIQYAVQPADTMVVIAHKHGVKGKDEVSAWMKKVKELNPKHKNWDVIREGIDVFTIPAPADPDAPKKWERWAHRSATPAPEPDTDAESSTPTHTPAEAALRKLAPRN